MIALVAYYRLWLLVAFLIGLATAWWTWGHKPSTAGAGRTDLISDLPPAAPDKPDDAPEPKTDSGEPGAPAQPDSDDLTHIKGIDTGMASMLNLLGIRHYGEIAAWSDADAEQMTVLLGAGAGRIVSERWIEQARLLASGNRAGHL